MCIYNTVIISNNISIWSTVTEFWTDFHEIWFAINVRNRADQLCAKTFIFWTDTTSSCRNRFIRKINKNIFVPQTPEKRRTSVSSSCVCFSEFRLGAVRQCSSRSRRWSPLHFNVPLWPSDVCWGQGFSPGQRPLSLRRCHIALSATRTTAPLTII